MNMRLRQNAEERLKGGTAPPTRGWTAGAQGLTLLHRLASTPETAGDALKLLHELQVHQVELDLQHEQAEQDRLQLTGDLKRYADLFDLAPFGYLACDAQGRVIAVNRIAAAWLEPESGEADVFVGRRIEDLLAPQCLASVRDTLAIARQGASRATCTLHAKGGDLSDKGAVTAVVTAVQTASAGDAAVMMAFMPNPA